MKLRDIVETPDITHGIVHGIRAESTVSSDLFQQILMSNVAVKVKAEIKFYKYCDLRVLCTTDPIII